MTKLEIQAIRRLPRKFICDGTNVATCNTPKGPVVVAINPEHLPIQFWRKPGRWSVIKCA